MTDPLRKLVLLCILAATSLGLASASQSTVWHYSVAEAGDHTLSISVDFGTKPPGRLHLGSGAEAFVISLEASGSQGFSPLAMAKDNTWVVAKCPASGCKLRYRFDLDAAAKALDNRMSAAREHEIYLSTLDVWLLHPEGEAASKTQSVEITVKPKAGDAFGLGLPFTSAAGSDVYKTSAEDLQALAPSVLGPLHSYRWQELGGSVDLAIAPALFGQEVALVTWVKKAASAVSAYYGRLPTSHILVYIGPPMTEGGGGVTYGSGGATILIPMTPAEAAKDLSSNWVIAHELVHTAMPNVESNHHWFEEGLATYIEPIARLRAGQLSAPGVFSDMIKGLPSGLPQSGDKGLDHTDSWGRTYWGGALFCFLADVTLRQRSNGRIGLETALRGVLAKGGSVGVDWPLDEVIKVADEASGYPVLRELYNKMKDRAWAPDLNNLWRSLGVVYDRDGTEGTVTFDDKAPLAFVRAAIVTGKP